MYPFCLQEVNQPAQFSQKEGCLKRVNCSRILWCIWSSRKRWASGLFRGARSEYQYLSWHPGVFSGSQDERRVHGWLLRNHMSVKMWPILDIRTGQLSKRRPGKATTWHVFCVWYPCVASFLDPCLWCYHPCVVFSVLTKFGLQRHSTWNGCSTYEENEVNLKTNQVKKGLWRNWKMLTLKILSFLTKKVMQV